jgi:hypothetical protein
MSQPQSQLKNLSGDELAFIAATISVTLSKGMNNNDVNILSSLFSAIDDNLGIIAARNEAAAENKT